MASGYNPVPSVAPTTSAPQDTINVRANPNQFGAQVGQAVEKLGATTQQVGQAAAGEALKWQGMLNETMATSSDTEFYQIGNDIKSKFKQKEGLEAFGAKDDTVKQITDARMAIRAKLPNEAARRAFDQLSLRPMGYAIADVNDYAATQFKQAHINSANASMDNHIQQMSDPQVALDPKRSEDALQNIRFDVETQLQAHGMIPAGPVTRDDQNNIIFPDTPQGKDAKSEYDYAMNKALTEAKVNQYHTLAFDPNVGNAEKAYAMLNEDKNVPPEARAKIITFLAPALKNEYSRDDANTTLTNWDRKYDESIGQTPASGAKSASDDYKPEGVWTTIEGTLPGAVKTSEYRDAEENKKVGGKSDSFHLYDQAIDFRVPKGMTEAEAAARLKAANPNLTVVAEPAGTKNSTGPHVHVQWGTRPTGQASSAHPSTVAPTSNHQTKADYYNEHMGEILDDVRATASKRPGADATSIDLAVSRAETQINQVRNAQIANDRADFDLVSNYINGQDTKKPITDISEMENAPPKIRDTWHRIMGINPLGVQGLERNILANSYGKPNTYGANSYKYLTGILSNEKDPNHIKDNVTLAGAIGKGSDAQLTNTGFSALQKEMDYINTDATTRAFGDQEMKFFQEAYNNANPKALTGGGSAKLDQAFQKQIPMLLNYIQVARGEGKTATQIFSPQIGGKDNPDYVGNHVVYPSLPEVTAEGMRHGQTIMSAQTNRMAYLTEHPEKANSKEELDALVKAKVIKDPKQYADIVRNNPALHKRYMKQQEKTEAPPVPNFGTEQ